MHIRRDRVKCYRDENNPVITNYKLLELSCMKDVIILYHHVAWWGMKRLKCTVFALAYHLWLLWQINAVNGIDVFESCYIIG